MSLSVRMPMKPFAASCAASVQVAKVLAEHGRSDERDALLRHVEALAILLRIDAGHEAWRDLRPLVYQHPRQDRAASHLDLGQEHGFVDGAEAVHANIGEEHR